MGRFMITKDFREYTKKMMLDLARCLEKSSMTIIDLDNFWPSCLNFGFLVKEL